MKKITVILLSLCLALCLAVMFISCDNGPETGMSGGGCNHEYGEEFFVSSSCTENGVLRKICKLCKEPYDTPTEAPGHTWITENEKLSSCTSDGYRNSRCEKCGTMNYEELKATGHKYEYGVQTQPTQESTGTLAYDCINCSNNGTAEMPVLTDSAYTKEVVNADITDYTYGNYGGWFSYTSALVDITVAGYFISSVSFERSSKLSKASIQSIYAALSMAAGMSDNTVTLSLVAVNKAFETSEGANDGSTSAAWQDLASGTPWRTVLK
jgi:hypothetical protein